MHLKCQWWSAAALKGSSQSLLSGQLESLHAWWNTRARSGCIAWEEIGFRSRCSRHFRRKMRFALGNRWRMRSEFPKISFFRSYSSRTGSSLMAPQHDNRRWSLASLPSTSGYGTPGSNSAFSVGDPSCLQEECLWDSLNSSAFRASTRRLNTSRRWSNACEWAPAVVSTATTAARPTKTRWTVSDRGVEASREWLLI